MKYRKQIASIFILLLLFSSTAFASQMVLEPIIGSPAATPSPSPQPTPANVAPNGLIGIIPLLPPGVTEEELLEQQGMALAPAQESRANTVDASQVEQVLQDIKDNPQNYPFTYEDILLTARLIYAEGHAQSDESFLAMATVVYNRYQSKKYPNSIEKIVFAPGQFTVVDDEGFLTDVPTASAFSAVIDVFINGNRTLPEDVMYFKSERQDKDWGKRTYYDTIGGNMYYS